MQILANDFNISEELIALTHRYDNEEIIDVAAIMRIPETETNETVELIEVDIGEELAGKIADDNATFGRLAKETFASGEFFPGGTFPTYSDIFHRFIIDNFTPNIL